MSKLTESEKFFLNFMEENISEINDISITKLSELANVSTATIFRTVKKLGYRGFSEYKLSIMSNHKDDNYYKMLEDGNEIKKIILKNQQEVNNTINKIDIQLIDDALNYLYDAECIYIFARGLSEQIGFETQLKFYLLNKRCELHTDPNIIKKISLRTTPKDCVMYISLSGESAELIASGKIIAKNEAPSILITTNSNSSLGNYCDIVLEGFKSNISYFPEYEVRSRLSLNVICRILLDAYANRYK